MKPTPEQLAFHEELKGILNKHQQAIGELAISAILCQVAGSVIAISMVYDGLPISSAVDTLVENAKLGINTGLEMIEATQRAQSDGQ